MQLIKILQSQGIGSKKYCQTMIKKGYLSIAGKVIDDPKAEFETDNLTFNFKNIVYPFYPQLVIAMNKPIGYECSHNPVHHHSVYELLPDHFIGRNVNSAGRLDQDSSGLLILSDQGQLVHRLTHPKQHILKTYHVTLDRPLTDEQEKALTQDGVGLYQEYGAFIFDSLNKIDDLHCEVQLSQGLYHQVKRMFASSGNHVNALHRTAIGHLKLANLEFNAEHWCILNADQIDELFA